MSVNYSRYERLAMPDLLKRLLILLGTAVAMLMVSGPLASPKAKADLMQCPYPATGFQAIVRPLVGTATGYICNYPTEKNMSHLHAELGGYMTGGPNLNPGALIGGPGALGLQLGIGMSIWSQSWRCPDERYIAAPPNGIGAWRDTLDFQGIKCPAVARAPLALDAPWPPVDPNIVYVVNQILPPGQPDPTAAPPPDAPPPPPAPELHPVLPTAPAVESPSEPQTGMPQIPLPMPSPGG